jgi:DNA uptake protein ComE-like DNA-binding protein
MNTRILKRFAIFISFALVLSTLALSQDENTPDPPAVQKLDINSANRDQLMKQLGLTEALSLKIIAGRPYRYKSDLIERKIITDVVYARITDLIVANSAKSR